MRGRDRSAAAAELATLPSRPLISVVMPTYDVEPRHLRAAIGSVRAQHYPDWELVIVDDGSTRADTRKAVKRAVSRDSRITARLLSENVGIAAASNQALELCRGELVDVPGPRRRAHARCPAAGREGVLGERVRRRLLRPGQDHRGRRSGRSVPQARLVARPRAGRDVRRAPAGGAARAHLGGRGLRFGLRHDPGLRAAAAPLRAHRSDPPHSRRRSTTGGRSRAASRSRSMRRRA